jgi:hypothetical protein
VEDELATLHRRTGDSRVGEVAPHELGTGRDVLDHPGRQVIDDADGVPTVK